MGSILVVNAGSTSLKLSVVDEERGTRIGSLDDVDPSSIAPWRIVSSTAGRGSSIPFIHVDVLDEIVALEPLAPLHNAPAVAGIERAREAFPELPHVAVFDTSFHRTEEAAVYALPARWREEWGYAGTASTGSQSSGRWSERRSSPAARARSRLVVCHLGGGCSVTAVRGGCSVDTSMGFSPLEGLPMTTRSGSVDPGALIYVLREHG